MDLKNKGIVLTGAASGIGRAILHELCAFDGVHIIAVDRDETSLRVAIEEEARSGISLTPYVADIADHAQIDALFDMAVAQMGQIDLFIANAGFAYYEVLNQPDWTRLEAIYQVNTLSPMYSAVKMRKLYGDAPYRTVITCSAMGHLALPGYAVYGGTKAALIRFAEAFRFELDDPRKLTMLYPIGTRTHFFESAGEQTPQAFPTQPPEAVARVLIRGLQNDRKDIYTSYLFRALMIADRYVPFVMRIEQFIENRRFIQWQKRTSR